DRSIKLEANVNSGCCSASKKSGDCRCAVRFSSLTSTLATRAEPERLSSASLASTSLKEPRKVSARYGNANPIVEWTGSRIQVPVGSAVRPSVKAAISHSSLSAIQVTTQPIVAREDCLVKY